MSGEQSFGERSVSPSFNPDCADAVAKCKKGYAAVIDEMNDLRSHPLASNEVKRMASLAITEAQTAQMWAVKAITWRE